MADKVSKSSKRKPKISKVSTFQLPQLYNKLLAEYVKLLEKGGPNPYEFSLQSRIAGYFNLKGQAEFATSSYISDFLKTPDTLAQEFPRSQDMLKKLDKFDNDTIRALARINGMNLSRLRSRAKQQQSTQRISTLAIIGSILALLLDFQDLVAVSIKEIITGLANINISLVVTVIIILVIILAIRAMSISLNRMFTTPRIGLVDALGEILNMAMAHRNLHE